MIFQIELATLLDHLFLYELTLMLIFVNPSKRVSPVKFLRYTFKLFKDENVLSCAAVDTGTVAKTRKSFLILVNKRVLKLLSPTLGSRIYYNLILLI